MNLDQNLYSLFATQAQQTPDAPAIVVDEKTAWTYQALARRAAQVCDFLLAEGPTDEEPVGVMMSRTPDMVAALLGILKAGGAYVPVDPDDPPTRQRVILENSRCRRVIAHRSRIHTLRNVLSDDDQQRLDLSFIDIDHIPATQTNPWSPAAPGGDRIAYILFTSGSTGVPKGVEVPHRAVANLLCACRSLFACTADDGYLAAATIGFDISVVELFLPLISGGRIVLRDRTSWLEPARLAADIRAHRVTIVQTGPSTWANLLAEQPDFPRVRIVISTAEAIAVPLARQLIAYGEQAWNLYGPTETTVWSTGYLMTHDTLTHREHSPLSVSIGQPLANTTALIVDEEARPVPYGQKGELLLGGLGLARGYRGNPELTAERFVIVRGERYYRTGDVAAWSVDGNLLYFGRNDDQMKIRGVRIDPAEVESAIATHPDVARTAATWYPTISGSRSIIAAIIRRPGASVTAPDLHRWLESRLPAQMIPSRFAFCESLPLSPSGKIDRNVIRAMPGEQPEAGESTAALTPTEALVRSAWQRVLQTERIGPDDHFFTIGGDSLAAVRVLTQIEAVVGLELNVQSVFRAPVLRDFAAELDRMRAARAKVPLATRLRQRAALALRGIRARLIAAPTMTPSPAPATIIDAGAPVRNPADILIRQHTYVDPWSGLRARPGALVVTLNPSGRRPGLFWCLQGYRELTQLAGHLGSDQPVHGMRSGYLIIDYDDPVHISVLADHYAGEIERIQPSGALRLGGNCQGGVIMLATAERLRARGREIGRLILMEQSTFRAAPTFVDLVFGRESHLNPYHAPGAEPDRVFRDTYTDGYKVSFISGSHGEFFESPNIESLAAIVRGRL